MLWFDVENGYKTTQWLRAAAGRLLWFDVEDRYKTTYTTATPSTTGCGLMQRTDIRQQRGGQKTAHCVVV